MPSFQSSVDAYQMYDVDGDAHRRNAALLARRTPDRPLEPTFMHAPIDTKHQVFPSNDRANPSSYKNDLNGMEAQYPPFNPETDFIPGTAVKGPWSGYVQRFDVESVLRQRPFAHQRYCDPTEYVPPVESHLYQSVGPYKHLVKPGLRGVYARTADEGDAPIATAPAERKWHASSRLEFHRQHDVYREYRR